MDLVTAPISYLWSRTPRAIPVDLKAAAEDLGVRYAYGDIDADGFTDLRHAPEFITLRHVSASSSNSLLPWPAGQRLSELEPHEYDARTRFTFAHEIAHVLVHRCGATNSPRHSSLQGPRLERLCDDIAGHILMPEAPFALYLTRHEYGGLAALRSAALHFRVSLSAAAVRSRRLGLLGGLLKIVRKGRGEWQPVNSVGLWRSTLRRLAVGESQQRHLSSLQSGSVEPLHIELHCLGHRHSFDGQFRRAKQTVVVYVVSIDGEPMPQERAWHCPLQPF